MVVAFGTFISESHCNSRYRLIMCCWFNKSGKTIFSNDNAFLGKGNQ